MSSSPARNDGTVTPSEPKANDRSGDDDAQSSDDRSGQGEGAYLIQHIMPCMSDIDDRSPACERRSSSKEVVFPPAGSTQGNTEEDVELGTLDVGIATLAIAHEETGSQTGLMRIPVRPSNTTARRARRVSPYDVEDMRRRLTDIADRPRTARTLLVNQGPQSRQKSSQDSAQASHEVTAAVAYPQSSSADTGDDGKKIPRHDFTS